MRRVSLLASLLLTLPALALAGELQVLVPEGFREAPSPAAARLTARSAERPIHEPTSVHRVHPALAPSADGFAMVWEDRQRGIVFGRLGADGVLRGETRGVASNTSLEGSYRGPAVLHRQPALAPLADGRSLLVWVEESVDMVLEPFYFRSTLIGTRVRATVLEADGAAAEALWVLDRRPGSASHPTIVSLGADRFLVGWRYESPAGVSTALVRPLDGTTPVGRVRRVDADGGVGSLALAVGADGAPLALWSGCCDAAGDAGVFARRLDRAGRGLGAPLAVNEAVAGRQGAVAVASTPGGFVAAWTHSVGGGEYRLRARPLGSGGAPEGSEVDPGSGLGTGESHPRFLTVGDGSLQMAWIVWNAPFRVALLARAVGADGSAAGELVVLTERHPDAQNVFALAEGRDTVVATWAGFAGRQKALLSRAFDLR